MPTRKLKVAAAGQRPAHRPEFAPTKEQRETVKVMVAGGIQQAAIASVLGITEPTLRKHFREEIDHGAAEVNAIVVAAHLKRVREGDMRAIEWWERSRMGWSEKKAIENTPKPGISRIIVTLVGDPAPPPRTPAPTIEHDRPGYEAARRNLHLIG